MTAEVIKSSTAKISNQARAGCPEKLGILSLPTTSVIPEAPERLGGIPYNHSLLATPSTLLRTVSLSNGLMNHGSRLRLLRDDMSVTLPTSLHAN